MRCGSASAAAATGPNRVAIRRHHAPTGGTESPGTVAIAISTDLAMSVAKAVAAGAGRRAMVLAAGSAVAKALPPGADQQADGREDPADGVVGSPGHDDDPDDHEGAESEQYAGLGWWGVLGVAA